MFFFPLQASLEGVQLELYQNIIVLVSEVNTCVMYACIIYVILCKCTVRVVSSILHECSDIFVCVHACVRACVCSEFPPKSANLFGTSFVAFEVRFQGQHVRICPIIQMGL